MKETLHLWVLLYGRLEEIVLRRWSKLLPLGLFIADQEKMQNYFLKEDGNLSSLGAMMQTVQEEKISSIRLIFKKFYFKQEGNLSSLSARIWASKEDRRS